jgi:hypothetical protein
MTQEQIAYNAALRRASETPYTGFTSLIIMSNGVLISPADAARTKHTAEEWLFTWQRDECEDYSYMPARRRSTLQPAQEEDELERARRRAPMQESR